MGVDRRKYVMSIDVAMQREMAYKEKLGREIAEQRGDNPLKDQLPTQLQTPMLSQAPEAALLPTPNQRPSATAHIQNPMLHLPVGIRPAQTPLQISNPRHPGPPSTPAFMPNPRPHPSVRPRPEQAPLQRPNPQPGIFQTPALTLNPRPHHAVGPRPGQGLVQRPSLQQPGRGPDSGPPWLRAPHSTQRLTSYPTSLTPQKRKKVLPQAEYLKHLQVNAAEDFYCHLCEVNCNSEYNMRTHIRGQKHKAKVREVQTKKALDGIVGEHDKLYCDLCGIRCPDMCALAMHLKGKNHLQKVHASQKKLKVPSGGIALN